MRAYVISKTVNSPYGLQTTVWPHSYGTYKMAEDELTKHLAKSTEIYKCAEWEWDSQIEGTLVKVIGRTNNYKFDVEKPEIDSIIEFRIHTTIFVIGPMEA